MPVGAYPLAAGAAQPPGFGLGYGPLSIEPATLGTPVYSPGDQVWVQSYLNTTSEFVSLTPPDGTPSSGTYLAPGALMRLRTFNASDRLGVWTVAVLDPSTGASSSVTVTLASPAASLVPKLVGSNLSANTLNLDYGVPPTAAYDIQGCLMGSQTGPSSTYQLPAGVGGAMKVSLAGNGVAVTASSTLTPINTWFELYSQRSYDESGALVSKLMLAAQTDVLNVAASSRPTTTQFTDNLNLRVGRYELRAYVRTASGLDVFESGFLRTNDTAWVSLDGCTQLVEPSSSTMVLSANLNGPNSTWPRSLYTMYDVGGIDSFNLSKVPTMEARIDLRSATNAKTLAGVVATVTGEGVQEWNYFDSSVHLVAASFPLSAAVAVDFEGVATRTFNVTIQAPFSSAYLLVPVGTIDIHAASGGQGAVNASVSVSEPGSAPASFRADGHGNLTIIVPPGRYLVNASYAGRSASASIDVGSGGTTPVSLSLGGQTYPIVYYALVGVLAVAAALNLLVWRAYLERKATFE